MPEQRFKVSNAGGMWLRTTPIVSEATRKVLLPKGHVVTKLGGTVDPDWWRISTKYDGADIKGYPNLVTEPEHALKPALEEWTEGELDAAADANDIRTITKRINGGLNGFPERKAFFARLLPLLKTDA